MTQPLASASRDLAVDVRRSKAVCAWDAEPIAAPSLELLLLPPPMTNSAYLGRYEELASRGAAARNSARTVSLAARPSRDGRGR